MSVSRYESQQDEAKLLNIFRQRQLEADALWDIKRRRQKSNTAAVLKPLPTKAVALESFSKEEIQIIADHFEKIAALPDGEHHRTLITAVLEDNDVKFEFVTHPVVIRQDGAVIDLKTAKEMIEKGWRSPKTQRAFLEQDIIPCNAIILAMRELLNLIKQDRNLPTESNLEFDIKIDIPYTKFTTKDILAIEEYYDSLTLPRQRIFNILCRGSSGHILESPVLLPDGLLYEEAYVQQWLATRKPNEITYCPNTKIPFTKDDITVCWFARAAIEEIKTQMRKPKVVADDEKKSVEVAVVELSDKGNKLRTSIITEIQNYMAAKGLATRPVPPHADPKLPTESMRQVLLAAIVALKTVDKSKLEAVVAANSDYDKIKPRYTNSIFGTVSSASVVGKLAQAVGSSAGQPGPEVAALVNKVVSLLENHMPKKITAHYT